MHAPVDSVGRASFAAAVLKVERAATMIREAISAGSIDGVVLALRDAETCPPLIIQAADFLRTHGQGPMALELLERGLALDGPTAPVQHAYARHCRMAGRFTEAAQWLRSAMLRSRPNAAMALELCEIELAIDEVAALDMAVLAIDLRWIDTAGLKAVAASLAASARADLAVIPLMMLHIRKEDDSVVRTSLCDLFEAHGDFPNLPQAVRSRLGLDKADTGISARSASAHDRLVPALGKEAIATARMREQSPRWIADDGDLWAFLKARIMERKPFSFVRGGDGEGRFIVATDAGFRAMATADDADVMLQQIWFNWFGQDVSEVDPDRLKQLARSFARAFADADLVGLTSAAVIDHDQAHVGYRTVLDAWLSALPTAIDQHYTDASCPLFLHNRDPFFRELLAGQPFLGLISPHRDLASRLGTYLSIDEVVGYVVPGETPLGRPEELASRGQHFPQVFDRLMAEISVPFPGACYLIGAGLLGKIYADRIRQLGGIAIDIGALVDGWVGINSRRNAFVQLAANPLPPLTASDRY